MLTSSLFRQLRRYRLASLLAVSGAAAMSIGACEGSGDTSCLNPHPCLPNYGNGGTAGTGIMLGGGADQGGSAPGTAGLSSTGGNGGGVAGSATGGSSGAGTSGTGGTANQGAGGEGGDSAGGASPGTGGAGGDGGASGAGTGEGGHP